MSETIRVLKSLRDALMKVSREIAMLRTDDYHRQLEIVKTLAIVIDQLNQVIDQLEE